MWVYIRDMSQIIIGIIIANVLMSIKGFGDPAFFDRYKFQVQRVLGGEKIRMVSSGFLHVDWLHLGFNMYALYLFGELAMRNFSTINFLLIYLASLLAGSMYSLYQHKREPYYSAVGASGAVSGIMFSAIIFLTGAIGFDILGANEASIHSEETLLYCIYYTIEESLEMFGLVYLISILLGLLEGSLVEVA